MRARLLWGLDTSSQSAHVRVFIQKAIVGIICIVAIFIGLDAVFFHPLPRPAAVLVTNIQSKQVTVTFVTARPMALCVLAIPQNILSVRFTCEHQTTTVHTVTLSSLRPQTQYRMYIGRGVQWTNKVVDPVNGVVEHASYVPYVVSPFITAPQLLPDELTLASAPVFFGEVVDQRKNAQSHALVVVYDVDTHGFWSTQTNAVGKFMLLLVGAKPISDIGMSVWSASGYASLNGSLRELAGQPVTLSIRPYE